MDSRELYAVLLGVRTPWTVAAYYGAFSERHKQPCREPTATGGCPLIEAARLIQRHLASVSIYFAHRITNAVVCLPD